MGCHRSTLQHNGIGLHRNCAGMIVLAVLDIDLLTVGLETHISNLQGITAVAGSFDGKSTIGVRHSVGHYLLTTEQCCRCLNNGILRILFYNLS